MCDSLTEIKGAKRIYVKVRPTGLAVQSFPLILINPLAIISLAADSSGYTKRHFPGPHGIAPAGCGVSLVKLAYACSAVRSATIMTEHAFSS
jgi:hypothetical protein